MKPFLEEIADTLYQKYTHHIGGIKVVFPNRRAGLFFRKYLSSKIDKPVWAPEVLSIEDFIKSMSSFQQADNLTLIFELFKVYKKAHPAEERFERFYFWGEMLLKDFDDIDKYLVNPENIFTSLKNQKELDQAFDYLTEDQKKVILSFWKNFNVSNSRHKDDFIEIWQVLFMVYTQFKQNIAARHLAYSGMIFRDVWEKIEAGENYPSQQKVIFAGFNALTLVEEKIISWFYESGLADIYWDLDTFYMDNKSQEAGAFLRKYRGHKILGKSFQESNPGFFEDQNHKTITVTGVPLEVGQAKKLGELLDGKVKGHKEQLVLEKTVVVLPDEHLLFPVLHSMPDGIKQFNVTMGYPLRNTPLYGLLEHLLDLQQNAKGKRNEQEIFYFKNVLSLLRHPYILFYNVQLSNELIKAIEKQNRVYISRDEMVKEEKLYDVIFKRLTSVNEVFDYLLEVLFVINQNINQEGYEYPVIEQEYIYHFYTQLKRLKQVIMGQSVVLDLATFLKLFRQMMQSSRLPFTGEPLNGLQVMGVLETRNLDFENVFILSMNEGIFPSQNAQSSFIPYNLRKGFGLPTFDQQDATYAYHFYRLLQRAKNIHLLYNTESGPGKSGEMSRFIYQLMYETGFSIKHHILSNAVHIIAPVPISIEKDEEVMADLERYLVGKGNKRLTPSALNTFLDCRLKFYYKYVALLYEPEEVKEEVDAMVFGNLLHHCLEVLYKEFTRKKGNRRIEKSDFMALANRLDSAVTRAFAKHYSWPDDKPFGFEGRNIIVREIIKKMAKKILGNDRSYAPFEIIGLEDEAYTLDFDILSQNTFVKIGLKGIIDRIDLKDNTIRVIDYKTGKDNKNMVSIASLFDREHPNRNKAALQTMFYGFLFTEKYGKAKPVMPGVFNARDLFAKDFDIRLILKLSDKRGDVTIINDARPYLDEFKYELSNLLAEIYDPTIAFGQTDDTRKCSYCPYKGICHR